MTEDSTAKPRGASAPERRRKLGWLLVLLPLAVFLWAGEAGVDFGEHWDEGHRVVDYSRAARTQTLLPDAYNYPSMTFLVGVAAMAPEFARSYDLEGDPDEFRRGIAQYVQSDPFLIRTRRHFLLLSSLAILWVFAAARAWGRSFAEALVAAALLAGCFELGYHARWIAPDVLTMQFAAFTLVSLVLAHRSPRAERWLTLAAVGLGLAASTKYLAAVMAIPIGLTLFLRREAWSRYLRLAGISVLVFFVITPGALIQPVDFLEDLYYEQLHYRHGHYGFTVDAGADHLLRSLRYLILEAPSPYLWASLLFSALGAVGLVALWRESRSLALVVFSAPLLYLLWMSTQRVMFVRNLVFLLPFGALASARGFGVLWERWPGALPRAAVGALVGLPLLLGAQAVLAAGSAVREDSIDAQAAALHEHLRAHPDTRFQLSPRVSRKLEQSDLALPDNATSAPDAEAPYLAVLRPELLVRGYWPSNEPGLFTRVFGPPSANYDYYSTWPQQAIVLLERERALEIADLAPPEGIQRIFPEVDPDRERPVPANMRPSPHSRFKPGHRKQEQREERGEAERP